MGLKEKLEDSYEPTSAAVARRYEGARLALTHLLDLLDEPARRKVLAILHEDLDPDTLRALRLGNVPGVLPDPTPHAQAKVDSARKKKV